MPLWGKLDDANSVPTYLSDNPAVMPQADVTNAYFVDLTEVFSETNRERGIKTPGWNLVQDIGNGRLRVEPLVVMKVARSESGDSDGTFIANS